MSIRTGLWIDHRRAVIVTISAEGDFTQLVESGVERHVRYAAAGASHEQHDSQPGTPEDKRERHFDGELARYYDEVIACLQASEAIFIFGPGEAKGELEARLEHAGMGARIVGVETADKMTDRQIAAKVREQLPA